MLLFLWQKKLPIEKCSGATRCQLLLKAEVEGFSDKTACSENPLMLETNGNVFSEYGILPAKTMHQTIDDGVSVLLYNPCQEEVELCLELVLGRLSEVEIVPEISETEMKVSKSATCDEKTDSLNKVDVCFFCFAKLSFKQYIHVVQPS